jgi:hypothetical protein
MVPITGDGNGKGETTGCGRFHRERRRGGSTVREADGTTKSSVAAEEAEGSNDWRLEVEDDRRKLGRWAGPVKKIWLRV